MATLKNPSMVNTIKEIILNSPVSRGEVSNYGTPHVKMWSTDGKIDQSDFVYSGMKGIYQISFKKS